MTASTNPAVQALADHQGAEDSAPSTPSTPWPSLEPEALFGIAGDIVCAIAPHTEADPVAILVQLLAGVGSAAGRCPYFVVEADRHGVNLNTVLVGDTARGRKGTSWGHVRSLMADADPEWFRECIVNGLSSGEGLIWAVRDPIYKLVKKKGHDEPVPELVDSGVSDKRLLVIEGEYAQVLKVIGREGNTLSPILRNAWDGHSLRSMTKNSPARATDPHIAVVGHITSPELQKHLGETETTNGYANRVLWACVRRSKLLPDGGSFRPEDRGPLVQRLREVLDHAGRVGQLKRDETATDAWHAVYQSLSSDRPGVFGSVVARAEAHVTRLALLYAVMDRSVEIRVEHLSAALALWKYCEDSARYIFGDSLDNRVADRLLAIIRARPEGVTRSEMNDALGRHVTRVKLDQALTMIKGLGLAEMRPRKTTGRPAEVWYPARKTA